MSRRGEEIRAGSTGIENTRLIQPLVKSASRGTVFTNALD
jgi:hypothetical protein